MMKVDKVLAIFSIIFFVSLSLMPLGSTAQVMESTSYQAEIDSFNVGGVYSSSTSYQVEDTIGEGGTGSGASTGLQIKAGYQQGSSAPQCNDGIDNDSDGAIDFPADLSCGSLYDDDESSTAKTGGPVFPTCVLTASPSTIDVGDTVTLDWSTVAASSATIDNGVGAVGLSGSTSVSPTSSLSYTMQATSAIGTAVCQASVTVNADPTSPGVIQFATASVALEEDAGVASVNIQRVGGSFGPLQVQVTPQSGSAEIGSDVIANAMTLDWADGDTNAIAYSFEIIDDLDLEDPETFSLVLSSTEGGVLGTPTTVTVMIADNEEEEEIPEASITVNKVVINDNGGTANAGDFTFSIDGKSYPFGTTVVVDPGKAFTLSESSLSGYQFVSISGGACPNSIPGSITLVDEQFVTCTLTNDDIKKDPEKEKEPEDPDPDPIEGEDDDPGVVQFITDNVQVDEDQGFVDVELRRTGGSDGPVSIDVRLVPGLARSGDDYDGANVTTQVNWNDGEGGSKYVRIPIIDDSIIEDVETFSVVIDTTGTTVGGQRQTVVAINDNDACVGSECLVPEGETPIEAVTRTIRNVTQTATKILEQPIANITTKVVATAGVVSGAASLLATLFSSPLSLSELFLLPLRIWSLILSFLGIRKRHKPWGVVYDSQTKQPLDPAYVSLLDENGKEVDSAITDLDGRYGFLVKPGVYTLAAKKTHYTFPSQKMTGRDHDELYNNLYYGDTIIVREEGQVISKNIPMDPEAFDWNEFAKRDMGVLRTNARRAVLWARITNIFFVVGFTIAVVAFFLVPAPYNLMIFLLYLLMLALRVFGLRPKHSGQIKDKTTGQPLSFAVIKIFGAKTNVQVGRRVADQYGRYYALVGKGEYVITIEKKLADGSYQQVFSSDTPIKANKGIINSNWSV
jgi:hypothetical protein